MAEATVTSSINRYAGFWRRAAALFIDEVIIWAIRLVFLFLFGSLTNQVNLQQQSNWLFTIMALQIIGPWLYFAGMESSNEQATLGKALMGLRVTDMQYRRIAFWRASVRYFSKYISGIFFGLGFLQMIATPNHQGFHDEVARCFVIYRGK